MPTNGVGGGFGFATGTEDKEPLGFAEAQLEPRGSGVDRIEQEGRDQADLGHDQHAGVKEDGASLRPSPWDTEDSAPSDQPADRSATKVNAGHTRRRR